jgi:hypothetical protein
LAGPDLLIIDPAPAIARQTKRVFDQLGMSPGSGTSTAALCYSTAGAQTLVNHARDLIHLDGIPVEVEWSSGAVFLKEDD